MPRVARIRARTGDECSSAYSKGSPSNARGVMGCCLAPNRDREDAGALLRPLPARRHDYPVAWDPAAPRGSRLLHDRRTQS